MASNSSYLTNTGSGYGMGRAAPPPAPGQEDFTVALDKVLARCEGLRSAADRAMKTGDEHQTVAAEIKQRMIAAQQAHEQNMRQLKAQLEEARRDAANAQAEAKECESKAMFATLDRDKALDRVNKLINEAQGLGIDIPQRRNIHRTFQPQASYQSISTERMLVERSDTILEPQLPAKGGIERTRTNSTVAGGPRQSALSAGTAVGAPNYVKQLSQRNSPKNSPRNSPKNSPREMMIGGSDEDLFGGLGAGSKMSPRSQEMASVAFSQGSQAPGNYAGLAFGDASQGSGLGGFGGGGGLFDGLDEGDDYEDDDEFAGLI